MPTSESALLQTVRRTVDDYGMLQNVRRVVVGFSGGADSVCLLSALHALAPQYGVTLTAVHVHHGIRGEEADRDAAFSREICEKLGVSFVLEYADVPAEAALTGESTEACGRRLRYACLREVAGSDGVIATAHNANDNAETVLLNLTRGASLRGACGIPPVRDGVIRPLLFCTRDEIEAYCRDNGLSYVTDSTNLTDEYARNRVRHGVLPGLEAVNPAAVDHFGSFTVYARRDDAYLTACAEEALDACQTGEGSYSLDTVRNLPEPIRRRFVQLAVRRFTGDGCDRVTLEGLLKTLDEGGRLQLCGPVTAEAVGGSFRLFLNESAPPPQPLAVSVPFSGTFGGYALTVAPYTKSSKRISRFVLDNLLDYDKIDGELVFRTREAGDLFAPARRGLTKPLKKLLQEEHVPLEERDALPLLCDRSGIVWVCGVGVAERCRPEDNSTHILFIGGKK